MKKLIILLLTGFMLIPFSCEKVEIAKDVPSCIKKKIIKENNECLFSVTEYIEETTSKKEHKIRIYEFSYNHPQCSSLLPVLPIFYDEECHEIVVFVEESYRSTSTVVSYDNIDYRYNRMVYEYYYDP